MLTIDPKDVTTKEWHGYMLRAVGPRPIAFASTISDDGVPNLAPYSFFNAFSSNPPTLVFSSNLRVRDTTGKDTLANIRANGEVVINVVSHSIVKQMALASVEFDASVNEFEKAGFTSLPSETIKPLRVAESPVHFECKVQDIVSLGEGGGAGNLFICRVQRMHIHDSVLDADGKIDLEKIDLCGRMGGFWYTRAKEGLFEMPQPVERMIIGFDGLPDAVKNSTVLSGNDLAYLADVTELPTQDPNFELPEMLKEADAAAYHQVAKELIAEGDIATAWQVLLAY